ncbi:MAG TPA: TlpA disulfide reductase family protein [Bacillota bacterium]|nr:TlpA disulfide reductase family protein [Bacillota bacterium]
MRKRHVIVGFILIAAFVLLSCYQLINNPSVEAAVRIGPMIGNRVPDFLLSGINGESTSLNSVIKANKVTLVNFWGIWCPYCVQEIPELVKFYQQFAGQKVELLGVNVGDAPRTVPAFARSHQMNFPILYDRNNLVSTLYQIQGFPTTLIIDQKGIIRERIVGATNYSALQEKVQRLLKEK